MTFNLVMRGVAAGGLRYSCARVTTGRRLSAALSARSRPDCDRER